MSQAQLLLEGLVCQLKTPWKSRLEESWHVKKGINSHLLNSFTWLINEANSNKFKKTAIKASF